MASCNDDDLVNIEDGFKPIEEILHDGGIEGGGGPTYWGSSFWARAKRCPYDGLLVHRDGHEPARSQALVIGILFHVAMAVWYRSRDRAAALRVCQVVLDWCRTRLNEGPATWPSEVWGWATVAQGLVTSYLANWSGSDTYGLLTIEQLGSFDPAPHDVLFVEQPLYAMPPVSPFPISVRTDIVYRALDPADGKVCVVIPDHKTTRHESPEWLEAWWQDDQLMALGYVWRVVMEPLGWPPVRAVMVNAIEKPRGRNDLPQFHRHVFPVRADRLEVWKAQMLFAWREIEYFEAIAKERGISWRYIRQNFASCFGRKYSVCPRLEHCLTLRDMDVYAASTVPQSPAAPVVPSQGGELAVLTRAVVQTPAPVVQPLEPAQAQSQPVQLSLCASDKSVQQQQAGASPAPVPPLPSDAPEMTADERVKLIFAISEEGRRLGWDDEKTYVWVATRFAGRNVNTCSAEQYRLAKLELSKYRGPASLSEPAPQQAPPLATGAPARLEPQPSTQPQQAPPPVARLTPDRVVEMITQEQIAGLEAARVKAGWTAEQVDACSRSLFAVGALELTRESAKKLILAVLDAADDTARLTPPVFDDIMAQCSQLTGGATEAIRAWLLAAEEPAMREYAARFPGQGDRFNNIKGAERLRAEIAKATLEDIQAALAAQQTPAPPPEVTVEDLQAQITACPRWKPIDFDPKHPVPVTEAVTGTWYLVRGMIAMASPERDETQRTFILPSGVKLGVGFLKGTDPMLCVRATVVKDDPDAPASPPEVSADEAGSTPDPSTGVEAGSGQGPEPGLPRQVGEAAKPTGVVKVFWLGHHKRQQKAKDLLQGLWKDNGDSFGLALCGKAAETEKLKAFTYADGVAVETTAKSVGSALWEHFGTLVKGL